MRRFSTEKTADFIAETQDFIQYMNNNAKNFE